MKGQFKPIAISKGMTSTDAAMNAHDYSMSENPQLASQGRIFKDIMPVFEKWLLNEMKREISQMDSVSAVSALSASMAATISIQIGGTKNAPAILELIKSITDQAFQRAIDTLKKEQK